MGTNLIKILGVVSTVGAVAVQLLSGWVNKQQQDAKIAEEVAKAVANLPAKES